MHYVKPFLVHCLILVHKLGDCQFKSWRAPALPTKSVGNFVGGLRDGVVHSHIFAVSTDSTSLDFFLLSGFQKFLKSKILPKDKTVATPLRKVIPALSLLVCSNFLFLLNVVLKDSS